MPKLEELQQVKDNAASTLSAATASIAEHLQALEVEEWAARHAWAVEKATFKSGDLVRGHNGHGFSQVFVVVDVFSHHEDDGSDPEGSFSCTTYRCVNKNGMRRNLTHSYGTHPDVAASNSIYPYTGPEVPYGHVACN